MTEMDLPIGEELASNPKNNKDARARRLSLLLATLAGAGAITHTPMADATACIECGYGGDLVINPVEPSVEQGTQALVDVGFTNLFSNLIGSYDLTITWDPTLLSFAGVSYTNNLDGPADSIQGYTSSTGSLEVYEVSLGSLSNQTGFGALSLFEMTFDTLATGVSPLSFDLTANGGLTVGDEVGASYTNFVTIDSSLEITPAPQPPPVSVPEPNSFALFCAGGFMLALQATWRVRKRHTSSPSPQAMLQAT